MKKFFLSRTQWQILFWLTRLCPCSQKELLNHVDIDAAQLARILDGLEKNDYILRTKIPEDRRSVLIKLTDYAKKNIIPHLENTLEKENEILLEGISTPQRELFFELLKTIEMNIENRLMLLDGDK